MKNDFPPISGYSFIADIRFPQQICSSIFVPKCNFKCPMCINRKLINSDENLFDIDELIQRFLLRREKEIVISGGEPFIHSNINKLFEIIKNNGMIVSVATNGYFFNRIKESIDNKLIDYIIMDVKNSLNKDKYSKTIGINLNDEEFSNIIKSINYIKENINCEFRTTVCRKFVTDEDVYSIAKYLGNDSIYILQPFYDNQVLDMSLKRKEYIPDYNKLQNLASSLIGIVRFCIIREV